ncbi:hypothetical protein RIF29_43337 [Crotalaria pallida]|uniref:Uncharacterized protein n=1 Tax=Crotalaria pallida TaxID=3830 RepID=A0AAN9HML8_CROPI
MEPLNCSRSFMRSYRDRPSFSFPLDKEKEEKKGLIIFFHVNGPIFYRKVFRAIHHVEKDQPPMYRTLF